MLNDLLWLYGTKRQYDMQKENGLAGIIGILVTFLIVWQWNDWFYPIFESVGLVSIAKKIGLNTGTPIHTTINVLGLIVGLILIFFILVAISTFLILSMLNLFGSNFNSNRPTPLQYAFSLLLLPLMIVIYPIFKLMKGLKIIRPDSTESFKELNKEIIHGSSSSIEESYTAVFVSQEQKDDVTANRTVISQKEAISTLNRAIASLEDMSDYVFAYSDSDKTWYLLTPNPIPPYASKILVESSPQKTPYNYEELYERFVNNTEQIADFYVPASKVDIFWDENSNHITLDVTDKGSGYIFNCTNATKFEKLQGNSIEKLYKKATNKFHLNHLSSRAHVLSYALPLAYPEEIERYKSPVTPSYYRELQKVPYIDAFAPLYRADVIQEVKNAAARNNKWAIDYLTNLQN
ncbi:hypothetical protein PVA17_20255 [Lysinibacillus sp. CNPSo 3705]|uniref:hypothetical protein n=1 Tax=Lysinibacillus sp. CNPSo 3705 TaxID=3028148 RepID=UPI0023649602|nr:hypothetical protein [Lysinibacillus sp. CNPSo 3705]MDD1505078.1 hypothetical protein [Lysinibacillus sp. CNPSo 3705]